MSRERKVFVYRIDVEVPAAIRWPNRPSDEQVDAAVALGMNDPRDDNNDNFQLPVWRDMLSGSTARRKANILRALGCTVTVRRSAQVTFPPAASVGEPQP